MAVDPKDVRKVKPFPFPGQFKDARGSFAGQIVKLTIQGLMIEVTGSSVQPGEKVEVNFVTPVLNGVVVLAGVVVKVYNQLATDAKAGTGAIHLVEVHFRSVPEASMKHIAHFLEKTGPTKRGGKHE
jgi:hypothetical protein